MLTKQKIQMPSKRKSSVSVYDFRPQRKYSTSTSYLYSKQKSKDHFLDKKIPFSGGQISIGIAIGVILIVITIVLQFVAFYTPHWKEISPQVHSLYVDGVDALIRTEILVYFNAVHRFTHHSYGLFRRCEYILHNSSKAIPDHNKLVRMNFKKQLEKCTKNFVPSYSDANFDVCHSLLYYQFCSKAGEKNFDISNHYRLAAVDVSSNSYLNIDSKSPCDCQYPVYLIECHILGILIFVSLFSTALLFTLFPFLKGRHRHLQIKCFGALSSLFAIIFIFSNQLIILNHLEYESVEYLTAIERHYRLTQIYKLSHDTKVVIDRFLSSIKIETGYSATIGWLAFVLSIIDGIFLMITCKISRYADDTGLEFTDIPTDTSPVTAQMNDIKHKKTTTSFISSSNTTEFPAVDELFTADILPSLSHPLSPSLTQSIAVSNNDNQSKEHLDLPRSYRQQHFTSQIRFQDEI